MNNRQFHFLFQTWNIWYFGDEKYVLLMYWMCFGSWNNYRKVFRSWNNRKRQKTVLPDDFWVNRVTATQTMNPSLFGQPMNCPETIGADLGNLHEFRVVGSAKNVFYVILRNNIFRKNFTTFHIYLCRYLISNK